MQFLQDQLYRAAIYVRLSKEDGDFSISPGKTESNSIANQKELLRSFAAKHPELEVVGDWEDDGYTGTNFDRPGFVAMMAEVQAKRINCIIVKDLSRFGRDYIEAGRYIEKIFPALGVRFIAVNDNYDSASGTSASDNIIIPFKNLINDSYSRDISVKVRSHLEVKRQSGQFIANFPVYGYLRTPESKNQMMVDEAVANVVRDIFKWAMEGMSPGSISQRLNAMGVLSPFDHKRASGSNFASPFRCAAKGTWSSVAVVRILKNEVYTGTLVQGKRTTPNYKVKKELQKPEEEWARVEGAHEAILSPDEYQLAQRILAADTRRSPGAETVYLFAGRLFCTACGSPMVRKLVSSGKKKYATYVCSAHKANREVCAPHSIREDSLEAAALAVLQAHIAVALDMERALERADAFAWEQRELGKIDAQCAVLEDVTRHNGDLKVATYEDLAEGVIDRAEYMRLRDTFSARIEEAKESMRLLQQQKQSLVGGMSQHQGFLAQFQQYKNLTALTRPVVVALIDRIEIAQSKQLCIHLHYEDQFATLTEFLAEKKISKRPPKAVALPEKEAV